MNKTKASALLEVMKEMDDERWIENDNLCEYSTVIVILWSQMKWIYVCICCLLLHTFLGDEDVVCKVSSAPFQQSIPALDSCSYLGAWW